LKDRAAPGVGGFVKIMLEWKSSRFGAITLAVGLLAAGPACAAADVWQQAAAERIVSQYKTVFDAPPGGVPSRDSARGPLLGNGSLGAVLSGPPEAQRFWLSKNNFWRLIDGHRTGGPRLFGGLEVNIPALAGGTYLTEQLLFPAVTLSRFTKGASTVTMRSLVAATDDVLLVELAVEGQPVEVETRLWAAPGRGSTEDLGRKDALLWATKAFSEGVKIPTSAASALTVIGGQLSQPALEPVVEEVVPDPPPKRPPPRKAKSQPGPKFTLQPGGKVTVAVAVQSSFDAKDPLAAAQHKATGLTAGAVATLLTQHAGWWRGFWAKSLVEIGDPIVEQRYYLSNYLMGSSSRDREFPPGLFGIWVTDDDPRWAGDYHLNYNYEAPFYGLYSSNHLEQAAPYHAPVLAFMERGRYYAGKLLNVRGVYYSVGIGAMGIETCRKGNLTDKNYQEGGFFSGQKCNAAYALVPMSMHWYHTYDKAYAKTVYPFVLEVANFWEDYLKFENGRYVIYNDCVVEAMDTAGGIGDKDFNSIMSLGLVRNAFETALDMGKELGIDGPRRDKWQHILQHISAFPTFEKDGKTVFRYTEKGIDWWVNNTCGVQHIYPAGAIGLDSDPKLLEISRNTIAAHSRWIDNNGMNSFYPAAVRVGYDPQIILKELRGMIAKIGGTNGLTTGIVEGIENCSIVPNTINEMLCMSHGHVLRLFAVWPKTQDARFMSLRTWDAFLVSSALKDGAVQFVKLVSEQGRPCTLLNPWPGKAVDVYRDGKKLDTLKGERVTLKTEIGATLVLVPEDAPASAAE
jgi:alpha-L-fucosidase 2